MGAEEKLQKRAEQHPQFLFRANDLNIDPDRGQRRLRARAVATEGRGLHLLGAIQAAMLPEQGVLAAPAPRLHCASKHLWAPSLRASAESSCRRRCRARRPTPAGSRCWGRSTPRFGLSKVCHLRPRRAASAPQSASSRDAGGQRRPRALAAAGGRGGPRPAPLLGAIHAAFLPEHGVRAAPGA